MEDKYIGIVCKYSSRYFVSYRKSLLNNCFSQKPRNVGPNQFNLIPSGNHVVGLIYQSIWKVAVMAKDFVARYLCRLNHCQLLQIQQFFF